MRWTWQHWARKVIAGRVRPRERTNGMLTNGAAAYGEIVLFWRPDAGVKFTEAKSAQPGLDKPYSWMTVANKPGHRGGHV